MYDTEKLKKQALKEIKEKNLHFIEDVADELGIAKGTFYEHKLHESDEIKEAIWEQKRVIKRALRSKWFKSENPALQIALYRLSASKEELELLTQNSHKVSGNLDVKEDITIRDSGSNDFKEFIKSKYGKENGNNSLN